MDNPTVSTEAVGVQVLRCGVPDDGFGSQDYCTTDARQKRGILSGGRHARHKCCILSGSCNERQHAQPESAYVPPCRPSYDWFCWSSKGRAADFPW